MSYSAIIRAVFGSVWAIEPEKLKAIAAFLQMKAGGGSATPDIIAAIRAENELRKARELAINHLQAYDGDDGPSAASGRKLDAGTPGSVMVLPLYGIINQRYAGDFSGPQGTSVQQFTQQFRQAMNDPNVKAIVIDVDSPGGTVSGVDELATEIYNARKTGGKKITAVSNCLCASAAYWIASQANELCVSPSSITGSIGVYQLHEDDSTMLENLGVKFTFISAGKYKVEGNSVEPLGDEARSAMQGMVDDFYGMFTKAVARGRNTSVKAVQAGFGEGRVLTAQDAVKQSLADRIATLDEVLAKHGVKQSAAAAAAAVMPAPQAGEQMPDPNDDAMDIDCECECGACVEGDCSSCTHEGCACNGCEGCPMGADSHDAKKAQAARAARERRFRLAAV